MAFSFNKFNGDMVLRAGVEIDGYEFVKLENYIGEGSIINVDGYFFTNGKYGKQVVVVGNGAKINMPKYATKYFERIDEDEEAKEHVMAGDLVIVDICELETRNGNTVGFKLADAKDYE